MPILPIIDWWEIQNEGQDRKLRGAYFPKVLGNILCMMHIGVLSTKIGVFYKNFALKFVTLQTNFGKIFLNFEEILKIFAPCY